jgi:hypothetical protein
MIPFNYLLAHFGSKWCQIEIGIENTLEIIKR